MTNEIRTMHLFAGVGGGILADLILGHRPVVAVEWDAFCCQVLRERVADGWFDGMHVWEGDVQLFDPSEYKGGVDCIHAGFPCQDISVAGNQAGVEEGTRSGLYREVLRIADVVQPRYVFLENVSGIVTGDDGGMLRTVVGDLAARGYDAVWTCLSAAQVGANHKRDRWWLLGERNLCDSEHPRCTTTQVGGIPETGDGGQSSRAEQASELEGSGEQYAHVADSESLRARGRNSEERQAREREVLQGEREGREVGSEAEGRSSNVADSTCSQRNEHETDRGNGEPSAQELSGNGDGVPRGSAWWQAEPDVGRVADGVPDVAHRLKALGNGQVPLQAATAFRILWGIKNPD